jgi:hypothetical protein
VRNPKAPDQLHRYVSRMIVFGQSDACRFFPVACGPLAQVMFFVEKSLMKIVFVPQ